MRLGSSIFVFFFTWTLMFTTFLIAEEKITTSPLLNLDQIKPTFEDIDEKNDITTSSNNFKNKKKETNTINFSHAVLIGLDKITAKSSKIILNLNEAKKYGPLEIKILKCGKVNVNDKLNDVAYMQVKDLSKSANDQVFIFNGWTFSSDPNLTPFDHAIYDLQLLNCYNV